MTKGADLCLNCYLKEKSKHLPSAEELKEKLIEYNGNFTQVGKLYGVIDNSVRKWCKKYGMPYHSSDYKVKPQKKPNKIPVDQLDPNTGDIIQTFESANAAAHSLGKNRGSHITEACQGKFNIIYGYSGIGRHNGLNGMRQTVVGLSPTISTKSVLLYASVGSSPTAPTI